MDSQSAIAWLELEEQLHKETPKQWLHRLSAANTNEFNMLQIALARFATNTQIKRVLTRLDKQNNLESCRNWKQTYRLLTPSVFKSRARYRLNKLDGAEHFLLHYTAAKEVSTEAPTKHRRTVIGFTGSAGLLMVPISCVLAILGQAGYDLLVIRRKYRSSYFDKEGSLLLSIANDILKALKEDIEISTILGTSNGGLAGIYMAHMFGCPLGIALGAGATPLTLGSSGPLHLSMKCLGDIYQRVKHRRSKTRILLAASGKHEQDRDSALLLSSFFNTVHQATAEATAILFPECEGHGLPEDLAKMGFPLEMLLMPLINQRLYDLPAHESYGHHPVSTQQE